MESGSPEGGAFTYVPLTAVHITNKNIEDRHYSRLSISAGSSCAHMGSNNCGSKIFEQSSIDDMYYVFRPIMVHSH